ncbi:MAG: hypothetical protein WD625_11420, partial [Balneolales bacterium]
MSIKKFTGDTLAKARAEAIHTYGDKFIILESRVANGSEPASITVSVIEEDHSIQHANQQNTQLKKKPPSTTLFDPILKQIGRIFETTGDNGHLLPKNGHNLPESATSSSVKEKGGVSFIRSSESFAEPIQKASSPEAEQQEDPKKSFREHFKRKPVEPTAYNSNITMMDRRIDLLERMVWKLAEDHQSNYTYHPLYQYLRNLRFRPELVIEWFENWEQSNNQAIDRYSRIAEDIKAEIERYFKPSHPLSEGKTHLFSSFSGTNVTNLAAAAARHLEHEGSRCHIAIIFSNAQGFNKTGRQMIDSLLSNDLPCQSIVTHYEWQKFIGSADEKDHIVLITEPMPYNIEIVEERWEHYNRVLGEYH